MNKLLIPLVAATALTAVAVPAAAQPHGRWDGGYERANGSNRLESRIDRAIQNGRISPYEARTLRTELRDLKALEWRYNRDGQISRSEGRILNERYARLETRLRVERRDRDYGYGYGSEYRR